MQEGPERGARGLLIGERGSTWFSVQPRGEVHPDCCGCVTTRGRLGAAVPVLGQPPIDLRLGRGGAGPGPRDGRQEVLALQRQQPRIGGGRDGGGARHVAQQRDLTDVVARASLREQPARRRDVDRPLGDDVEPVPRIALAHDLRARGRVDRDQLPADSCSRTGGAAAGTSGSTAATRVAAPGPLHSASTCAAGAMPTSPARGRNDPATTNAPREVRTRATGRGRQRRAHREPRHQHGLLESEHAGEHLVVHRALEQGPAGHGEERLLRRPTGAAGAPRPAARPRKPTKANGRPVTTTPIMSGGTMPSPADQERGGGGADQRTGAQRRTS